MDAVREIKDRLGVEEVIGDYLELRRSGSNLKAKSPFTNEKTASFMVSPQKQIWHDFSSNKGGDIFSFVMEMEGVDFKEALKILAKKANIELKQFAGDGKLAKKKASIYRAVELSVNFYQKMLVKTPEALNYVVKDRGYKRGIIEDFSIGYSPASGQGLINYLTKNGVSRDVIQEAGLAVKRSGKLVDMFRGRIMIPLKDERGNPVGYTARVLDNSLPKYINTPQTLLYDKSRHLFGFSLAKEAIRQAGFTVVVEGNMDVIASHKADVKNVVASAGTALTKQHLSMLARFSDDVRLAFDSDSAGMAATERTIPIAQELGINLSIIDLSGGKDPDEIIKANPENWQKLIDKKQYSIDWLLDQYKKREDVSSVAGKKAFSQSVLKVISKIQDPVEIDHYVSKVAKILDADKQAIRARMKQLTEKKRLKKHKAKTIKQNEVDKSKTYLDLLLGLNLIYPELRSSLKKIETQYLDERSRRIVQLMNNNPDKRYTKTPDSLQEYDDYVKIILFKTEELYGEWSSSDLMFEAIGLSRRLTKETEKQIKQTLTEKIKQAEASGNDELRAKYLEKFNELLKEN